MLQSTGSRLGHYEIEAPLGSGGMGEVYRARDTRLGRVVALKVLSTRLDATPALRERFAREARAISSVEHPNICALYDVGAADGVDFIVMQFVEGETLAARLARGPLPWPEARAVALQIAQALEAAHERGVVHRDLKPSNVQLAKDGPVKLLDFGLAKILMPEAAAQLQTQSPTLPAPSQLGVAVGTLPYMSPEQARGGSIDRRTDIWAFGCVLYEMLSGCRAFDGSSAPDVLAAVVRGEPDWARLPAEMPSRSRELVQRCLRKDARQRLRDIGDARLELEEPTAGLADDRAARPRRSRSELAAWSIAAAAAVLAALALARPWRQAPEPRETMRFSVVTNLSGVEAHPSFSPDGRSVAFISNLGGQWDVYVALVRGGSPVRITNDLNLEQRPRWSPDGSRLLFQRLNAAGAFDVWVVPALGGDARLLLPDARTPAWSSDGRSIAYSARGDLWICDENGRNSRALTHAEPPLGHLQPAFARDGRSVVFVRRREGPYSELEIVDVASGKVRALTQDGALANSPAWSSDGRFVYFTSTRGGTLNVWKTPAAGGEPQQVTAGRGDDAEIDVSADGTRLVFSTFRANVNVAERALAAGPDPPLRWLTTDSVRGEHIPRYSHDGRRIAYFTSRGGAEPETLWVMESDGSNPRRVVEDGRRNIQQRWMHDSKHLIYVSRMSGITMAGSELRRVDVAGGAPETLLKELAIPIWGDVAPDGRLLLRISGSKAELFLPGSTEREPVELLGEPTWARDGSAFSYVVSAEHGEERAGLWISAPGEPHRRLMPGWVTWSAWTDAGELLATEARPDLTSVLWRVGRDGRRTVALERGPVHFLRQQLEFINPPRFDVHPDGSRIAFEALESFEADISMIEFVK
jgi:serine/threonine protein kinase/Tol biopolymer transport system component